MCHRVGWSARSRSRRLWCRVGRVRFPRRGVGLGVLRRIGGQPPHTPPGHEETRRPVALRVGVFGRTERPHCRSVHEGCTVVIHLGYAAVSWASIMATSSG